MTATFPYRFVATEGMYAGTTFVYRDANSVISYQTDSPACYHLAVLGAPGAPVGPGMWWPVTRHEMTPERLARYEATPLRDLERKAT